MPKIIYYPGVGRKCPLCNCYFGTNVDYNAHMETHWRKSSSGKGEWIPKEAYPALANMINTVGTLVKDGYRYTIIDNKIIYRTKIQPKPY